LRSRSALCAIFSARGRETAFFAREVLSPPATQAITTTTTRPLFSSDYTEGPFSEDVLVANNRFEASPRHQDGRFSGGMAVVQATGCVPSSCTAAPPAPPPEPYPMPPCASGGTSQPPVVPHVGDTDGPGRILEGGNLLLTARVKLFRNFTLTGNTFTSSSRFVDIGAADGVVMEGNTLIAVPGWGAPSGGAICVYGSTGFNSTCIAERNMCYNGTTPVACGFCMPPTRH
jgi:hypothetical protein